MTRKYHPNRVYEPGVPLSWFIPPEYTPHTECVITPFLGEVCILACLRTDNASVETKNCLVSQGQIVSVSSPPAYYFAEREQLLINDFSAFFAADLPVIYIVERLVLSVLCRYFIISCIQKSPSCCCCRRRRRGRCHLNSLGRTAGSLPSLLPPLLPSRPPISEV